MKKRTVLLGFGFFLLFTLSVSAAQVIPDTELDKITGQTGIVLNVVLDSLIGDDDSQLSDEEKDAARELIEETFGPLTRDEVEQIIHSHQLFAEMIQQLPEEDRKKIEEAFEILTSELKTTAPVDMLQMTDGSQLTADNIDDWAQDKVSKILIAQQIINDMFQSLSPEQFEGIMTVQDIINNHLDSLKH